MASGSGGSGEVRIWVKVMGRGERNPARISVESNHQIYDIIEKTLKVCLLEGTVSPDRVKVTFHDGEVRPGAPVSDFTTTTTDTNPLLLQIEEDEGM